MKRGEVAEAFGVTEEMIESRKQFQAMYDSGAYEVFKIVLRGLVTRETIMNFAEKIDEITIEDKPAESMGLALNRRCNGMMRR